MPQRIAAFDHSILRFGACIGRRNQDNRALRIGGHARARPPHQLRLPILKGQKPQASDTTIWLLSNINLPCGKTKSYNPPIGSLAEKEVIQ